MGTPIFSLPFIGILAPPILMVSVLYGLLWRCGNHCMPKSIRDGFAWVIIWDKLPETSELAENFWEIVLFPLRGFPGEGIIWKQAAMGRVTFTVNFALLSTIASPMLILGSWLAFYVYSGTSDFSGISHAYQYYYHVGGFPNILPDLLAFLKVADWET